MVRSRIARIVAGVLFALSLTSLSACKKDPPLKMDFSHELAPGQLALEKIGPADYPDFSQCTWNIGVLDRSVDASLEYMGKPSSRQFYPYLDISHDRAIASLRAFKLVVQEAQKQPNPGQYIDQQIRSNFEVYRSIGAPNPNAPGWSHVVQFTGYCTPDRDASWTRQGPYQWPIYKKPADLAQDPVTGAPIGRKSADGRVIPYYTREQIEKGHVLDGQELAFLKSRWEAYVVTIQGSGRLRIAGEPKIVEIGYAGHNGFEYSSPGREMVKDGVIAKEDLNLRTLATYFAAHPDMEDKYLALNQRTVFFAVRPGGPWGKLNVPVTTFGTIATDKDVYPRAMPAFLQVAVPRRDDPTQKFAFSGFMMDQDAGGAIRAAGRTDIYMGMGDEAEAQAGHQLSEGGLYYVALKPTLVPRYAAPLPSEKVVTAGAQ